jgi:hypothetical protein
MPTPLPHASEQEQEDLPDFLRFAPVPVRSRRDGWTPALQFRFVLSLSLGAGVDEAARRLGRSRQTAYALRRRAGAEQFAAAWDAAVDFAREARGAAAGLPLGGGGSPIETLLVPRTYRGRLVGFVQREDLRGAVRLMNRLERIAERIEARTDAAELRAVSESLGPLLGS